MGYLRELQVLGDFFIQARIKHIGVHLDLFSCSRDVVTCHSNVCIACGSYSLRDSRNSDEL